MLVRERFILKHPRESGLEILLLWRLIAGGFDSGDSLPDESLLYNRNRFRLPYHPNRHTCKREDESMSSPTPEAYLPVDWAFLTIGVCIIAAALIFGSRWQAVRPVDLTSEKFGTIKLPFVPLLILLGVAFAAVGVYFRWQETQIGTVQHQKPSWKS
jgi:hypothetical protein